MTEMTPRQRRIAMVDEMRKRPVRTRFLAWVAEHDYDDLNLSVVSRSDEPGVLERASLVETAGREAGKNIYHEWLPRSQAIDVAVQFYADSSPSQFLIWPDHTEDIDQMLRIDRPPTHRLLSDLLDYSIDGMGVCRLQDRLYQRLDCEDADPDPYYTVTQVPNRTLPPHRDSHSVPSRT